MNIYLDFSVLARDGAAVGRVSGAIDFAAIPPIGSSIVLTRPSNGVSLTLIDGFSGHLQVEDLRFEPSSSAISVAASLKDVVVPTIADGLKVMRYLADGFGLFAEEYDQAA
jgi:hypothetical protein